MAHLFKVKPGDLIEIFRGAYQHWAVYIGENEVVHFTTDGVQSSGSSANQSSRAKVKREKLRDVVGTDRFKVNNLKDDLYEAHEPYVIVKEACAMVGRVLQYNVVSYNCQHFATDLRYGKAESRQVQTAAVITGVAVAGVAFAALGAVLFSSLSGKEEKKEEEEEEDYRKKTRRHHQHWH